MVKKYQTLVKVIVITIIIMIVIKLCLIFLWPFLISLLLVFLLEPMVNNLCRLGVSRKISVILSIIIIILVMAIIVFYLSQYMYKQIFGFFQNLSVIFSVLDKQFPFLNINKINYNDIMKSVQNMVISSKEQIISTIMNTFNGFINSILIIMSTVFISFDYKGIKSSIKRYISSNIYRFLSNVSSQISKIIKVEFKLLFFTTLITIIGLYIIGINNALTIGLICGILDLLPIVGPATVFVPYITYEFIIDRMAVGIGLIVLYILLQITREILKVKLVGENLEIHPFVTLLSIYIGVLFYGISGVFIGPILVIVIMELFNLFAERSRHA